MVAKKNRRGRGQKCCCDDDEPPEGCPCNNAFCGDLCLIPNYSVSGELLGASSNLAQYVPCYTTDLGGGNLHYEGCGAKATFPSWPPPTAFDCSYANRSFAFNGISIGPTECAFTFGFSRGF